MRNRRERHTDRDAAEQLLRRASSGPTADPHPIAELLARAAGPASNGELAGHNAALAAFREARLTPVPQPRRPSMLKTTLAKFITVKVLAVAATVTAAGGVALAAGTGTLPGPLQKTAHDVLGAPAATSSPKGGKPTAGPTSTPSAKPSKPSAKPSANAASPSPSLVGLCRAYAAGVSDNPGAALENPAFTVLITAAGGKDKVKGYCATVLADPPGNKPTAGPTTTPDAKPGNRPSEQPGNKPTTAPTKTPAP